MPVLVEALGHTSETQTRRYCGLTVDDMTKMHLGVSNLLESARARMSLTHEAPKPPAMMYLPLGIIKNYSETEGLTSSRGSNSLGPTTCSLFFQER